VFRLNRNERSYWSGNGVHVESELVFMIGRNMQEGDIKLSGYAVGYIPVVNTYTSRETFNRATIDGGAFNGAVGNIGVNVSSGTNNLQANNLSLAAGFAK